MQNKKAFYFSFVIVFTVIFVLFSLVLTSCSKLQFEDEDLGEVFTELFDKKHVSEEDLQQIVSVNILTYGENNIFNVFLDGYENVVNSDDNKEINKYIKSVDISKKRFSNLADFKYLTNLKEFSGTYTAIENFDFLLPCENLETFKLYCNYQCEDYTFLKQFSKLKKLELDECIINDTSFLSELTNIEKLSLNSAVNGDYLISDLTVLSTLVNLKELSVSSAMVYDITPLSNLINLEYLNLAYNGIEDVTPLSNLTKLKFIDLTQNLVNDLTPLSNFDAENFEVIILDLNTLINDWSPLDYLGTKVQGRPLVKN